MTACGSLQHIFDKPLSESPASLLDSLSYHIQPVKPTQQPSFTEIFGELHFHENSPPPPPHCFSSSATSFIDLIPQTDTSNQNKNDNLSIEYENNKRPALDFLSTTPKNHQYTGCHKNADSFSPRSYESLQLCTEGLGFESFDDVEDLKNDINDEWKHQEERASITTRHMTTENQSGQNRRSRLSGRAFPPPISCIGKSGKLWVSFKSYRQDGRFVLKQVKIPSQEVLHACREDGRLKLHFVQPRDEILEEEEEEFEEEETEENYTEDDEQDEEEETGNENHNYKLQIS